MELHKVSERGGAFLPSLPHKLLILSPSMRSRMYGVLCCNAQCANIHNLCIVCIVPMHSLSQCIRFAWQTYRVAFPCCLSANSALTWWFWYIVYNIFYAKAPNFFWRYGKHFVTASWKQNFLVFECVNSNWPHNLTFRRGNRISWTAMMIFLPVQRFRPQWPTFLSV